MIKASLVYLLLGPEVGEKDKYLNQIIQGLKKEKGKNPEVFKFFPYDINIIDVITLLRNGMLFSDHKVVIIENIHDLKKSDVNALIDYCKNPSALSSLILCSDQVKAVPGQLEKLIPDENRKIFWELFENQKKGWIVNFFKKYKITLENDAVDFMVEMVENNTKNMRSECEQLALFFDQDSVIKYSDIENFIYHSKEESVFTLSDQILKRDLSGAMEVLHKILLSKEDDPLRIINGILWQMRILLSFCSQLDEGYRVDEIFMKLKVKSKRRQKALLEAKDKYTIHELELIIMLSAQFEVLLKSMKTELHNLLLELFIYLMIVKGGTPFSHL
ncbi:MAG: DNA polymerase III subunit delta [Spirochaetales bacterium]|nr:DNA polymerase III subunit delta [Spirochaetales bacterium]